MLTRILEEKEIRLNGTIKLGGDDKQAAEVIRIMADSEEDRLRVGEVLTQIDAQYIVELALSQGVDIPVNTENLALRALNHVGIEGHEDRASVLELAKWWIIMISSFTPNESTVDNSG